MTSEKPCLPSPDADIRREYGQLISDIDQQVQLLATGTLANVCRCGPGCADCCMAFTVLPLEAALLAEALSGRETMVDRQTGCLFLRDGLCAFIPAAGDLPHPGSGPGLYRRGGRRIEVSACPLNFPEDAPLEHDDLLFMDLFNERLAALNLRYCRLNGLAPERRVALADLLAPSA